MIWVVVTKTEEVFESFTKKEMVRKLASLDKQPEIKNIFYVFKDDRCNELCVDGVRRVQEVVDQEFYKKIT